ncbi:MAG: Na+/H+ antiporter subunit C [bacterium]
MIWLLSITIGALVTAGSFLIMQRRLLQLVFGLSLLGHATNLMIVASGWVGDGRSPVVPGPGRVDPASFVDPLPQAMVLTAIVISFAVTAFLLVLVLSVYREFKTDDVDRIRSLKG